MNRKAFEQGKKAASVGKNVESCPFYKGDARYGHWMAGFQAWRCSETLDLFDQIGCSLNEVMTVMAVKKKVGRPRIHDKKDMDSVRKNWDANYKAKKKRIDVLVDPSIDDRWKRFLSDHDYKRERAIDELLKKSGY